MHKITHILPLCLLSFTLAGCQKNTPSPDEELAMPSPSSIVEVNSVVSDLDLTNNIQPDTLSITPKEIFRNDSIVIATDSIDSDSNGTYLFLSLQNISEKNMYLVCESAAVNGVLLDCITDMELAAGQQTIAALAFNNAQLHIANIDTICSINFTLNAYDLDSAEELFPIDPLEVQTSGNTGKAQPLNMDGQILYDKDGVQLIAKGATLDNDNSPVVVILAVNQSAEDILVTGVLAGSAAETYETAYNYEIPAGLSAITTLSFYDEYGNPAEDIKNIPVVLMLSDSEEEKEIGRTQTLTFNSSIIEDYLASDGSEDPAEKENIVSYSGEDAANEFPEMFTFTDEEPVDELDEDGDYVGIDEHEGDYLSEDDD